MRKDSAKFLEILLKKRGELGQDAISCDINEFMEIPNVKFNVKAILDDLKLCTQSSTYLLFLYAKL